MAADKPKKPRTGRVKADEDESTPRRHKHLRLNPALARKLDAVAAIRQMTITALVEEQIRPYLRLWRLPAGPGGGAAELLDDDADPGAGGQDADAA